jgi:hypothetical protein
MSKLLATLERIAVALEAIAASPSNPAPARAQPAAPLAIPTDDARNALIDAFSGQWVTTTQIAAALGLVGLSARQVAALATSAGFPRKRSATGIMFAIGGAEATAARPGPRAKLPDGLDKYIDLARSAYAASGRRTSAKRLLYVAAQDLSFKVSQGAILALQERLHGEAFLDE